MTNTIDDPAWRRVFLEEYGKLMDKAIMAKVDEIKKDEIKKDEPAPAEVARAEVGRIMAETMPKTRIVQLGPGVTGSTSATEPQPSATVQALKTNMERQGEAIAALQVQTEQIDHRLAGEGESLRNACARIEDTELDIEAIDERYRNRIATRLAQLENHCMANASNTADLGRSTSKRFGEVHMKLADLERGEFVKHEHAEPVDEMEGDTSRRDFHLQLNALYTKYPTHYTEFLNRVRSRGAK